jgi:hypothetical protein
MKMYRTILVAHSIYILITAMWPIIDIDSFMKVTGPKTDIWLVKTVGASLIPVGLCMLSFISIPASRPVIMLGGGTAISFICIDVYYVVSGVIPDIYLADAFVEALFLAGWIYIVLTAHSNKHKSL